MTNKYFEYWIDLLGRREVSFDGKDRVQAAKLFYENTNPVYTTLLGYFDQTAVNESTRAVIRIIRDAIPALVVERNFNIDTGHDTIVIYAKFPILNKHSIDEMFLRTTSEEFAAIGIAALLCELSEVAHPPNLSNAIQESPRIAGLWASYVARKAEIENTSGSVAQFSNIVRDATDVVTSAKIAKIELDAAQQSVNAMSERFDVALQRDQVRLDEMIASAEVKLQAIENAANDRAKLTSAKNLWSARATEARVAFRLGFLATATLLIGSAASVVVFHSEIADYVVSTSQKLISTSDQSSALAATTFSELALHLTRLFFMAIPAVAVAWLVRFGMRFTMRSLALLDDARQREVMLETYVHLLGDGKVDLAHRPLMLAALFRPLPGHGGLDVEPPSWSEAIKAGE